MTTLIFLVVWALAIRGVLRIFSGRTGRKLWPLVTLWAWRRR